MGANCSSTVRETRAPIATATTVPSFPSTYGRPTYRPNPDIRAPPSAFPEAQVPTALAPPPTPALRSTPANTNRILAFHSTASWKAFFEASKASNRLVVVYFTATWCGPCRYMEPTFNEYAAKYTDVDFVKIDVDELFNVANEYGIQTMPNFLFLKRGKEVDKVVGARKEELQRKIEKHRV